ncbi:hypothetical protein TCAL_15268 [Tigriopus californicus]|uniref:Uncharacterized protein n=1 Tax=Tigriopus californicus TaxID=6832 RepID=A0A553NER8_TIGCA|nr:hypothetical protein TCAL_15268 [Tigriopus californicus]
MVRLEAMCFDGVKRLCHIRGSCARRSGSINPISFWWDFETTRTLRPTTTADEARNLKSYGEFPEHVKINETVTFGEEGYDDEIEFDDVDSSEEENDIGGIDDI